MSESQTTKTASQKAEGFSAEEKAAMKNRAKELKAEARANKNKAEGESAAVAALDALPEPEREMARRLHELIKANAPDLAPKTWYGMPAYANAEGKIVCFFQSAQKFGTRYATLGFNDAAHLDDGEVWPVAYAIKSLSAAEETRISALIKKAVR